MISGVVVSDYIYGFSVGEAKIGSLNISHLLFVDDTLLFCEASQDHIHALRAILQCFDVISRLKVNLGKSYVVPMGQV